MMQISNESAMLNIQNQLTQNSMQLTTASVATQVTMDASNLEMIAPDIAQLVTEQIAMPIAYEANAMAISIQNAAQDAILDIKA